MKTLFFCNLVPMKTGAFETVLAAIGQAFREGGDEFVVVFAGNPIPPVADSLRASGVRWHTIPEWAERAGRAEGSATATGERVHPWHFVMPALGLIRLERPDVAVVHFGNELPTLAASLLARAAVRRPPRWIWQQDQQIQAPGRLSRRLSRIRLLALGVDRFVAVYEGGRQSLVQRGIPAARISVIHNSVAPYTATRPKGWLRKQLGIPAGDGIAVSTGSLIPRKRIDFILRAFGVVTHRRPAQAAGGAGWHLLVIGEGPERERLVALARELAIDARVRFLGLRDDVREILAEADLLVHASLAETCTYAVTESMAAGIPAVVTEAGAAREQIEDGVSGYILDSLDTRGFEERLERLLADASLRARMGREAEARWRKFLVVETAAKAYHNLYARTAAATPERGAGVSV